LPGITTVTGTTAIGIIATGITAIGAIGIGTTGTGAEARADFAHQVTKLRTGPHRTGLFALCRNVRLVRLTSNL
jgi:hypothetical protein